MSIIDIKNLQKKLCKDLCLNVRIEKHGEFYSIETPFYFPDGDSYQIYLEEKGDGEVRLTDKGHLLMQMSYDMDIRLLYKGTRNHLRKKILGEVGMEESEDGEFYIDTPIENLAEEIFTFGQGLTRVYDLLLLQPPRASSVFYDNLEDKLYQILGKKTVTKNYLVEGKDNKLYRVDYCFMGKNDKQVYLYGVPSSSKVELVISYLEHLASKKLEFEPLLVFKDKKTIDKNDLAQLRNVMGKDLTSSDDITSWDNATYWDDKKDFCKKIMRIAIQHKTHD